MTMDEGKPAHLPYGRQQVDDDDVAAVVAALRSDWLTTGPRVDAFEEAFAEAVGTEHAVAVANGTAALHCAYHALGVGEGDEVVVPAMTFAATANAAVYLGARPRFADVAPNTLLVEPASVEALIGERTRAVAAVDYAGQPCDYDALAERLADRGGAAGPIPVVADACHALGGGAQGRPVGSLADLSTFSFHPVKPITSAEGGMVTTDDAALAARARVFRNHGITRDHRQREADGAWHYEMTELGNNYRLSDLHCALGLSQLGKLPAWVEERRRLARLYDAALADVDGVRPLARRPGTEHAYHLYVVRLTTDRPEEHREALFRRLREGGIGVNVHYVPVHLHPWYRHHLGTGPGLCPNAEAAYRRILSLPLFVGMGEGDVARVVDGLKSGLAELGR